MYVATCCLWGEGRFIERLEDATKSALSGIDEDELPGDLADDLKFILEWNRLNMVSGKIKQEPDQSQKHKLIEKILHILVVTYRK